MVLTKARLLKHDFPVHGIFIARQADAPESREFRFAPDSPESREFPMRANRVIKLP